MTGNGLVVIAREFTDDPWEDIEMPEGFDPKKNKFLRDHGKHYNSVIEGIKDSILYCEDGLVNWRDNESWVDDDRVEINCPWVSTEDNALWGMLLHAMGDEDGAKKVASNIGNLDYILHKDGVLMRMRVFGGESPNKEELSKEYGFPVNGNTMWGLFLHAVGDDKGAQRVADSIRSLDGIYGEGGLVKCGIESNGDIKYPDRVYAGSNIRLGLLLNAIGHTGDAKKIVESINNSKLYDSDSGLVRVSYGDKGAVRDIQLGPNADWGLLLHAVGDDKGAQRVANSLSILGIYREDGLATNGTLSGLKYASVDTNGTLSMFLHSIGENERAEKIVSKLMSAYLGKPMDDVIPPGAVVEPDYMVRPTIMLGLARKPESYKLFTGEK